MNEQNILIVRCGEVALKGMNKPFFEKRLVDRIRHSLKDYDGIDVKRHEGLIFVRSPRKFDEQTLIRQISKVFGVASISPAVEAPSDLDAIGEEAAREYGVPFLPCDFKKRGGFQRSIELSREYGLYRQNYCGCVFSLSH